MRLAWLILIALAFALPARAQAPDAAQAERDATVARVLASGDGRGPATAYVVARAIEAHSVILHLRTPFLRQRSVEDNATVLDIWTVRGTDGAEHEIHFRVPAPDTLPPEQREAERNIRRILTSGDGLSPETAFVVCTFWYIDALAAIGRVEEARELFEHLLSCRNHLGLLSEDIDPKTGELWGNFPQTYSMVGLINSATRLSRKWNSIL